MGGFFLFQLESVNEQQPKPREPRHP
jgi:hypothetical protein